MAMSRTNESGGARLKFLVVVAIIGSVAFIAYRFVPVAYQAYLYKDLMQHNVDAAAALGHQPSWIKEQLIKSGPEYGIPADAVIEPVQRESRMEVRVQYSLPIEFPGYIYEYQFDHTAKSTGFLTIK